MFFIPFDRLPLMANCTGECGIMAGPKLDFRHVSLVLKRYTVLGLRFRQHASDSLKLRDNNFK
jgi:hypothetical protein